MCLLLFDLGCSFFVYVCVCVLCCLFIVVVLCCVVCVVLLLGVGLFVSFCVGVL